MDPMMNVINLVTPTRSPAQSKTAAAAAITPPNGGKFQVGTIVEVARRKWPGINQEGGTARIQRVHEDATYDVKYVVDRRREKHVEAKYITLPQPLSARTPTPTNVESSPSSGTDSCKSSRGTRSSGRKRSKKIAVSPLRVSKRLKSSVVDRENRANASSRGPISGTATGRQTARKKKTVAPLSTRKANAPANKSSKKLKKTVRNVSSKSGRLKIASEKTKHSKSKKKSKGKTQGTVKTRAVKNRAKATKKHKQRGPPPAPISKKAPALTKTSQKQKIVAELEGKSLVGIPVREFFSSYGFYTGIVASCSPANCPSEEEEYTVVYFDGSRLPRRRKQLIRKLAPDTWSELQTKALSIVDEHLSPAERQAVTQAWINSPHLKSLESCTVDATTAISEAERQPDVERTVFYKLRANRRKSGSVDHEWPGVQLDYWPSNSLFTALCLFEDSSINDAACCAGCNLLKDFMLLHSSSMVAPQELYDLLLDKLAHAESAVQLDLLSSTLQALMRSAMPGDVKNAWRPHSWQVLSTSLSIVRRGLNPNNSMEFRSACACIQLLAEHVRTDISSFSEATSRRTSVTTLGNWFVKTAANPESHDRSFHEIMKMLFGIHLLVEKLVHGSGTTAERVAAAQLSVDTDRLMQACIWTLLNDVCDKSCRLELVSDLAFIAHDFKRASSHTLDLSFVSNELRQDLASLIGRARGNHLPELRELLQNV